MKTKTIKNSLATKPSPSHADISQRAYELWVKKGCPENRDWETWLEAERELGGLGLHGEAFRLTASPLDPAASDAAEMDDELDRMVEQPARRSPTSATL